MADHHDYIDIDMASADSSDGEDGDLIKFSSNRKRWQKYEVDLTTAIQNKDHVEKSESVVYVLKLKGKRFYVGRTKRDRLGLRIHEHRTGKLTNFFVTKFKMNVKNPFMVVDDSYGGTELSVTLHFMNKYGIENVRGSIFCRKTLSDMDLFYMETTWIEMNLLCQICKQREFWYCKGGNHGKGEQPRIIAEIAKITSEKKKEPLILEEPEAIVVEIPPEDAPAVVPATPETGQNPLMSELLRDDNLEKLKKLGPWGVVALLVLILVAVLLGK